MSYTRELGCTWEDLLERVGPERWRDWVCCEPALDAFPGLVALRDYMWDHIGSPRADELLGALVRLGAVDGGDDPDAAMAVALLLARGSGRFEPLRTLTPDLDALVAGQVWLRVRAFPWQRVRRAYAANILLDVRREVRKQLGVAQWRPTRAERPILMDPDQLAMVPAPEPNIESDGFTLTEVLAWATRTGVIDQSDRDFLLELIIESRRHPTSDNTQDHTEHHTGSGAESSATRRGRVTRRGLNTVAVTDAVGARLGVCGKTVRRRRDRIVAVLAEASADFLRECA